MFGVVIGVLAVRLGEICSKRFSRSNGSNHRVGKQSDNARAEQALRSLGLAWRWWTWPEVPNRHMGRSLILSDQTSTFPEFRKRGNEQLYRLRADERKLRLEVRQILLDDLPNNLYIDLEN
jgi:hypothetical protein